MGPIPGITSTAAAIQRGMARFDQSAFEVVADAQAMSDPAPDGDPDQAGPVGAASGDLASGLVNLQADSFANKVLFSVYRKQQEQLSEVADLIKPTRG